MRVWLYNMNFCVTSDNTEYSWIFKKVRRFSTILEFRNKETKKGFNWLNQSVLTTLQLILQFLSFYSYVRIAASLGRGEDNNKSILSCVAILENMLYLAVGGGETEMERSLSAFESGRYCLSGIISGQRKILPNSGVFIEFDYWHWRSPIWTSRAIYINIYRK